jgi:hypothetical protein
MGGCRSGCRRWRWRAAQPQARNNVRVRDVLAVTSRSKVLLRRIAELWPLLCQVLRSLVEVSITCVVKDARLQALTVRVLHGRERPPLAPITLAPIRRQPIPIAFVFQASGMGGKRRDLRRVPLLQTIAHVARKSAAHAAARSEDTLCIVCLRGLSKMIKDGLHVTHFDGI